MRGTTLLGVALALAPLLAACQQTVYLNYDGSIGTGGGGIDGGDSGIPSGFCAGGQIRNVQGSSESPDIIVALDRSASMSTTSLAGTMSRLDVALADLYDVVQHYQGSVRFGYVGFPAPASMSCSNGQACCADSNFMFPTTMAYQGFHVATTACDPTTPQCTTTADRPTDVALRICGNTYNMFDSQNRNRFVLLVTDGEPSCGSRDQCSDAQSEIAMLSGNPTQVDTVVIGIGDSGAPCLQQLALSGGHHLQNAPYYYHVTSSQDLQTAISSAVTDLAQIACTIDIYSPLSNPDRLGVFIDGVPVPHNMYDGWEYQGQDKSTIKLSPSWCDRLLSADANSLKLQSCSMGGP
ncbi:MAG TPA: vWA domain-containing protein [Polyangia bacterium]|nr:vWA domain-containing protein [Polyangia bacterium]